MTYEICLFTKNLTVYEASREAGKFVVPEVEKGEEIFSLAAVKINLPTEIISAVLPDAVLMEE